MAEMTVIDAVRSAMRQELERDESVVVMGEDVGVDGGIFRATDGLIEAFGENRVMDTPLAEAGIVGMAIGMAINGMRPIAEMQFSGFSYQAFHQIEGHASRFRWRTRGAYTVPMVIRMPYGAGVRALEHHSESREVYWSHTPGLKTVIPSGPRQARALLVAAIRDPDPVIFLEPKAIYRAFKEDVEEDADEVGELGKARVVREGGDITLVAYGAMLRRTLEAAETLSEEDGVEAEVVDVVSIAPLDAETIAESVKATGRAVVVHEAPMSYGPAGEIMARLNELAFFHLEAPPARVTGYDCHVPYFAREQLYLPSVKRILRAARETLSF